MSRWIALAILATVLHAASTRPHVAMEPHAGLATHAPSVCASCHADEVREWSTSLHARAWTDPLFQAEYAIGRDDSCRGCHAPSPERDVDGVDCAACHVQGDAIVAFADEHDAAAQSEACGRCHQFTFPADTARYVATDLLQRTLDEWRASRAARRGRSCIACHMPDRSHRLLGLDDPELLARAVRVEIDAVRSGRTTLVHAELRAGDLGHAFPTGDVFRRARLVVETDSTSAEVVLARELGYAFTDDGSDVRLREIADTRLAPDELRSITLSLDDADADELRWRLVIDRLDPKIAAERGIPPQAVTHVVADGTTTMRGSSPAPTIHSRPQSIAPPRDSTGS